MNRVRFPPFQSSHSTTWMPPRSTCADRHRKECLCAAAPPCWPLPAWLAPGRQAATRRCEFSPTSQAGGESRAAPLASAKKRSAPPGTGVQQTEAIVGLGVWVSLGVKLDLVANLRIFFLLPDFDSRISFNRWRVLIGRGLSPHNLLSVGSTITIVTVPSQCFVELAPTMLLRILQHQLAHPS